MADFSAWGPLELKITLGEVLTALAAAGAAWWVGHVIQRRHANERAVKDLLISLCNGSLNVLNLLSELIEVLCPRGGATLDEPARNKLMRRLTLFSNSVHTIEAAIDQSRFILQGEPFRDLKSARDELRPQITDPLVTVGIFDDGQLRQIQASVLKTREALIKLELAIIQGK